MQIKNIGELRKQLCDNLAKIESGAISQQKSLELCRMNQVIINTLRLEIDYYRYIKSKDKIDVEYALRDFGKPIGVSNFTITEIIPNNLQSELPTVEQIENELTNNKM